MLATPNYHPIALHEVPALRNPLMSFAASNAAAHKALTEIGLATRALPSAAARGEFLNEEFPGHASAPEELEGLPRYKAFVALNLLVEVGNTAGKSIADHPEHHRNHLTDLIHSFFTSSVRAREYIHGLFDGSHYAGRSTDAPDGPDHLCDAMASGLNLSPFVVTTEHHVGMLWPALEGVIDAHDWIRYSLFGNA